MISVAYFFVYALTLLNIFVWMVWPEFLFAMLWKWDIFVVAMAGPPLYIAIKNELKHKEKLSKHPAFARFDK